MAANDITEKDAKADFCSAWNDGKIRRQVLDARLSTSILNSCDVNDLVLMMRSIGLFLGYGLRRSLNSLEVLLPIDLASPSREDEIKCLNRTSSHATRSGPAASLVNLWVQLSRRWRPAGRGAIQLPPGTCMGPWMIWPPASFTRARGLDGIDIEIIKARKAPVFAASWSSCRRTAHRPSRKSDRRPSVPYPWLRLWSSQTGRNRRRRRLARRLHAIHASRHGLASLVPPARPSPHTGDKTGCARHCRGRRESLPQSRPR